MSDPRVLIEALVEQLKGKTDSGYLKGAEIDEISDASLTVVTADGWAWELSVECFGLVGEEAGNG